MVVKGRRIAWEARGSSEFAARGRGRRILRSMGLIGHFFVERRGVKPGFDDARRVLGGFEWICFGRAGGGKTKKRHIAAVRFVK
jgi:hypothetical protein